MFQTTNQDSMDLLQIIHKLVRNATSLEVDKCCTAKILCFSGTSCTGIPRKTMESQAPLRFVWEASSNDMGMFQDPGIPCGSQI